MKIRGRIPIDGRLVAAAKLPTDEGVQTPVGGSRGVITGWGCMYPKSIGVQLARVVQLTVLSPQECMPWAKYSGYNSEVEFCAGHYKSGTSTCPVSPTLIFTFKLSECHRHAYVTCWSVCQSFSYSLVLKEQVYASLKSGYSYKSSLLFRVTVGVDSSCSQQVDPQWSV